MSLDWRLAERVAAGRRRASGAAGTALPGDLVALGRTTPSERVAA